jgi:hypothetical protein
LCFGAGFFFGAFGFAAAIGGTHGAGVHGIGVASTGGIGVTHGAGVA